MNNFVYLKSFFDQSELRTVDNLVPIYANRDLLRSSIVEITKGILCYENVFNKHVLLKPNWVNHPRNKNDEFCLISNLNLVIVLIELLLEFKPLKITIGDAPIQSCNWARLLPKTYLNELYYLSKLHKTDILIQDFRRVIFNTNQNRLSAECNPISDYIIFDVGEKSFLEPVTIGEKRLFRVSHYDNEKLADKHRPGTHKYCITKTFFDADLVISIPKVKTHQLAGLTAALKNLVGLNGDKDYLPHYRKGGTSCGGDSYPGFSILRSISEDLQDIMNKRTGKPSFRYYQKLAIETWKLSRPRKVDQLGASWYGNDTAWRMVLDLNLIAVYGKSDGQLSKTPQRQMFSLCDAIISGQGEGPLFPEPLPMGFISFTNNAAVNDYIYALLMNYKPESIPLIRNSFSLYDKDFSSIYLNGKHVNREALEDFLIFTHAPVGWEDYLTKNSLFSTSAKSNENSHS